VKLSDGDNRCSLWTWINLLCRIFFIYFGALAPKFKFDWECKCGIDLNLCGPPSASAGWGRMLRACDQPAIRQIQLELERPSQREL
jgi:hypothetical protein